MNVDNFDTNKSQELSDSDLENVSGGSKGYSDETYNDDGTEKDVPSDNDDDVFTDDPKDGSKPQEGFKDI